MEKERYFIVSEQSLGEYGLIAGSATVEEANDLLARCSAEDDLVVVKGTVVSMAALPAPQIAV